MALLSETQMKAANRARPSIATKSRTRSFTSFLILLLVPLSLPIFWSGQLQQRLLPTLRPYLPSQLRTFLPVSKYVAKGSSEERLSPEALLKACHAHRYTTEIISLDPLVVYINNFTSTQEAEELINIGSPDFDESFISRSRGSNQRVTGRTSTSAPLPLSHPLVSCILTRARTFMGSTLLPSEPFSTPQLVRYSPGQKYDLHTDFWPEHQILKEQGGGMGRKRLFNRVASFFVFLRDNCTRGETYFPLVEPTGTTAQKMASAQELKKWYGDKVARGEKDGVQQGVKFKPITGNAIFWLNLNEKGEGDRRVVHAGLPVAEGQKIGLNIWPRKFYGYVGGEGNKEKEERTGWGGKWKE